MAMMKAITKIEINIPIRIPFRMFHVSDCKRGIESEF